MEHILPRLNKKMSPQSRLLYGLTGGTLLSFGIKRGSLLGGVAALVGVDLLTRGATGHHIHEALGITDGHAGRRGVSRIPHQLGVQVQRAILVNATPEKAYEFVRNLENLPRFMKHVKTIRITGDKRSHWVVKAPAGRQVEWDAEIINDLPGELIAWRSVNNPDIDSAGSIHFERSRGDRGTIIRVSMQYLPPAGVLGVAVAKLFGEEPELQLRSDLRRLKQILETGETPTTAGQPFGGSRGVRTRPGNGKTSEPAGLLSETVSERAPEWRRAAAASGRTR